MKKPGFAIVGCGRLGTALGKQLFKAGYPLIGLASRSLSSAAETAQIIGTDRFGEPIWEMTREADVVFITTPDGMISQAFATIAERGGFKRGAVVVHCSGAHPSTILPAADYPEIFTGSMHPLQSFSSKQIEGNPFSGIIISVEGTPQAVSAASSMAVDLKATCINIPTQGKTLYHAAAVVASNYLVTVLDLAIRLMETAGVSLEDAFKVLKPLISGTLENIEKSGTSKALTGPIIRGDLETVHRHISSILARSPEFIDLYKTLGRYTVRIAGNNGSLNDDQVKALHKLLKTD